MYIFKMQLEIFSVYVNSHNLYDFLTSGTGSPPWLTSTGKAWSLGLAPCLVLSLRANLLAWGYNSSDDIFLLCLTHWTEGPPTPATPGHTSCFWPGYFHKLYIMLGTWLSHSRCYVEMGQVHIHEIRSKWEWGHKFLTLQCVKQLLIWFLSK